MIAAGYEETGSVTEVWGLPIMETSLPIFKTITSAMCGPTRTRTRDQRIMSPPL